MTSHVVTIVSACTVPEPEGAKDVFSDVFVHR